MSFPPWPRCMQIALYGACVLCLIVSLAALYYATLDHAPLPPFARDTTNPGALGEAYSAVILKQVGDAWISGAEAHEAGATLAEARALRDQNTDEARTSMLRRWARPRYPGLSPDASEPRTAEEKAAVVRQWRDFGLGMHRAAARLNGSASGRR